MIDISVTDSGISISWWFAITAFPFSFITMYSTKEFQLCWSRLPGPGWLLPLLPSPPSPPLQLPPPSPTADGFRFHSSQPIQQRSSIMIFIPWSVVTAAGLAVVSLCASASRDRHWFSCFRLFRFHSLQLIQQRSFSYEHSSCAPFSVGCSDPHPLPLITRPPFSVHYTIKSMRSLWKLLCSYSTSGHICRWRQSRDGRSFSPILIRITCPLSLSDFFHIFFNPSHKISKVTSYKMQTITRKEV